jgi:subtilisin family serine protease
MVRRAIASAVLVGFILTPVVGFNSPGSSDELYREGEVVVKFSEICTPAEAADIAAELGATVKYRFRLFGAEHWQISTTSVAAAIQRFASDPRIEYIEPNYRLHLDATYPNDPQFDQLWGMYNRGEVRGRADADIDATNAWEIETGGDVIVGVCDSGVDYNHEDLAANIYVNPNEIPENGIDDDNNGFVDDVRGWDFGDDDNDPMDEHGHGSHVAGTIAAVGNNGVGVTGVNWNAKILPLKIVDEDGGGFTIPAAKAIEYSIGMGARVTNHSWGTSNPSSTLKEAIEEAEAAGALVVASAGNSGVELNEYHQHFPAGLQYDAIVTVANTTRNDVLAGSSNWSATNVDLAAPGSGIVSTTPGDNYESFTGTSMSAPHVTGAISLIWAHAPQLTSTEMKQLLIATVDSLPDLVGTTVSGGRLNLHRALAVLDTDPPDAVDNLIGSAAGQTAVTLTWTASGDDGMTGTAMRYDIRFSTQPIDANNFEDAFPVMDPPIPQPTGITETLVVSGLRYGTTYHFALRVLDSHGNASPVSNTATISTLVADPPPQIAVSPSSLVKTLMTGAQATKSFSIANGGPGELYWEISVVDGGFIPGLVVSEAGLPRLIGRLEEGDFNTTPPVGANEGFLHGVRIVFAASRGQIQDRWGGIIADLHARGATVIVSGDPLDPTALENTDVLWFTDVPPPASITSTEVDIIEQWVRGGGGLLLEGDDDISIELYNRILAHMAAGIEYSPDDGAAGVSTNVHSHESTDGVAGILFDQNGSILSRVSPPAEVLLDDAGGTPAVAAARIGSGRLVAMSDELSDDSRFNSEDNRHFANQVFGWLAGSYWASTGTVSGVVPSGQSTDVDVTLDARGLPGGIYEAELQVENNDPTSPTPPVSLVLGVTAAPDIAVSHSAVDFGVVFTTVSDTETLAVHNGGKETLTVFNVEPSGSDYSVDATSFTLAPGEGRELVVTVSPGAPGFISETLTITSNDPQDSMILIALETEASDPPVISITPDSLHEIRYGDETVTRTITISNDGEYGLEFLVVVEDTESGLSATPLAVGTPLGGFVLSAPSGELLVGGRPASGPSILLPPDSDISTSASGLVIFADDFEDGDYDGWEIRGEGSKEVTDLTAAGGTIFSYHEYKSPPGHFNGVLKSFGAVQPGYIAFNIRPGATDEADSYVTFIGSNNRYITYVYCSSGGQLCVNAGNPGEDCSIAYDAERWYLIELKNIDFDSQSFDYYVDRLLIKEGVPFMAPTDDIAGVTLHNYHAGAQAWWDEIVVSTEHIVTWLTTEPSTGIIPPHTSLDVEVTFDATQLFTGQHQRTIVISSNDPATSVIRVPAAIDVTAVPNIATGDTLLDFGKTVIGITNTLQLTIINRSIQEILNVTDITSDNVVFSANPASIVLPPNGRADIEVAFAPDVHGTSVGSLTIHSNDRDQPALSVSLAGEGVDPPVLLVVPDSLRVDLAAGESSVESVLVSNAASNPEAAELEFRVWVDDNSSKNWLSLSQQTGSVAPGSTIVVIASFDASELVEGDYPATVRGYVNIPAAGVQPFFHTVLQVAGAARLVVADSLAFGTAYMGYSVSGALTIENRGTAPLIVSDIYADRSEFTTTPAALTVAPGDSADVAVRFEPASLGPVSATLTIANNDTSNSIAAVALSAEVIEAPAASVSADSLWVSVRQMRPMSETITLENTGSTNLEWSADLSFAHDLAVKRAAPALHVETGENVASASSLMDVLWYGAHGPIGSALWTVAFDDIEAAGGTVTESSSEIAASLLAPYDIIWLGDTETALLESERDAVAAWVSSGGCLLIEADNTTAVTSYGQLLNEMNASIILTSATSPGGITGSVWAHETTHGVNTLYLPGPAAGISGALPPAGVLAVTQMGRIFAAHVTVGKGRVLVVTDWLFSDIVIHSADNRRFMQQVFGWLAGTYWLSVTPIGGSIPPGQHTDVSVGFDPSDLPPDDYRVQLDLTTNDPALPLVQIPLTMRVEPLVARHIDLLMTAGLNLRSWNVELDAESTMTILSPIVDAVETVQGFDGGGLTFDPTIPPQFNTLTTMDHFHGYWFRLTESTTLSLDGTVFDHRTPLPLNTGYNLVGYFPDSPDSTVHAIGSVIDGTDVVLGYEDGGLTFDPSIPPEFNTLQLMRPGFGYWIKMSQPDTLVYPVSPVVGVPVASVGGNLTPAGEANEGALGPQPNISMRIAPTREWIGVWGDDVQIGGDFVPVGTVVTAMDEDGVVCGWCVTHHTGQFGLMAVYGDDPDTEIDEGASPDEAVTVVVGDHVFEGVVWTGMGAVIQFNDVARLTTASQTLPQHTALHQNFPNPFNPETTIAYDLAAGAFVTLTVFDVRGKRVRVLVSANQPAGKYRVEWDGEDGRGHRVASGVYFYRFDAGSYKQTRKMVLLK